MSSQFKNDIGAATLKRPQYRNCDCSLCSELFSVSPDPNTQILYACDSCGDKFLDATSLAQHVRIHTAQALVMFQADSDFYQYTAPTATDGDSVAEWQPTGEHVIQEGELILHAQNGDREGEGGMVGETQGEGTGEVIGEEGKEDGDVDTNTDGAKPKLEQN